MGLQCNETHGITHAVPCNKQCSAVQCSETYDTIHAVPCNMHLPGFLPLHHQVLGAQ